MVKYLLYKIGQWCVSRLPLKAAYRIAVFLSDIQYFCSPRDRKAVLENLRVICGDRADLPRLAREVFRNFGKYLVEFFRTETFTEEFVSRHVEMENRQILDEALSKGRGVVIMTAHIGNWEMGGLVLGRMGYPLTAVALPHRERPVNELFNRQRAAGGVTVVPVHSAIRKCIRTLNGNGIVALLADRDFSATGDPFDFFGRTTMIPRGTAMFAYRTRAAVVPMFLRREEDARFKIVIRRPLEIPPELFDAGEEAFRKHVMKQQAAVIEEEIRRDPSQWMMFRHFWVDQETGPERITST